MLLDQRQAAFRYVHNTLSVLIIPIQTLVDVPFKTLLWVEQSVTSHQALQAENADLHGQLLLLKAQLQKFIALEKENENLRALLQSYPRTSERVLVAQIINIDSDPFVQEVVLNQGSHEGVYLGQPLLDANGVLGQVIEVGPFTSRALLLTDTRSAIPIEDNRNGVRGIVVGTGKKDDLQLVHVPATTDVKVGDLLVTSGLGERFPVDYPVGVVTSIKYLSGLDFEQIRIKPTAHFDNSHLVLLVWVAKERYSLATHHPKKEKAVDKDDKTKQQPVVRRKHVAA